MNSYCTSDYEQAAISVQKREFKVGPCEKRISLPTILSRRVQKDITTTCSYGSQADSDKIQPDAVSNPDI